jgi:hypothetical protein
MDGAALKEREAREAGRPAAYADRLTAFSRSLSPDTWAMLIIVGAVVLANLPYLSGEFDPNPLGPRSGLISAVTPGPLRGQPTLDPNNGFISQAVSHRAALDWIHLHLPWWNPYDGTGTPLAGDLQAAAMFPLTLLTAFSNGQLYERILLEILAGIATYLLLRRLGVRRAASAPAAVAFALNGTFSWFAHATINPVAFLPLLLLGIEHAYAASAEGRRGGWWLIAVAGALSMYAGFPEVAYIDTLLALCWFAWRAASADRRRLRAFASKGLAGAVLGTLLAGPALVASVDYFSHADLWLHTGGYFGRTHLPPQALPQLLLPYVYGPLDGYGDPKLVLPIIWQNVGGFLTTSLLLFALLGVLGRSRRGLRLVLLGWIVLALARIYDQPHFLGDVLGVLPGMSNVAFFRYAFASVELSVVVLAALGLNDLATAPAQRRRWGLATAAALALVAAAAIGARPLAHQLGATFAQRHYYDAFVVWGAAIVVIGAAAALVRDARARIRALSLVLVLDTLALFALPELSAPRAVTFDAAPVAFLARHLGQSRFFTLGPLAPNYGAYFGISSLNINEVPVPTAFSRYVKAHLDPVVDPVALVGTGGGRPLLAPSPTRELLDNLDGYRAAGVAYVLTPAGQALPQSTFTAVFRSPTTWIYQLAGASSFFTARGRGCVLDPRTQDAVRMSCPAQSELIRRETDLPGWSASIDGHAVPIRPDNGLFQAITVPAGVHRVTFGYEPPYILWGILSLVAGCAWLVLGRIQLPRPVRRA